MKYLASPREWYWYYCTLHGTDILTHTIIENRCDIWSSFQSVISMWCNFPKMVDGFEGREKEVIIFSTVWNNTGGHISFLAKKQWRGLVVMGSINSSQATWVGEGEGLLLSGLASVLSCGGIMLTFWWWVGVHCGQETLQRALMSSFWIGEISFVLSPSFDCQYFLFVNLRHLVAPHSL